MVGFGTEVIGGWTVGDIALEVASLHPAVRGFRVARWAYGALRKSRTVAKAVTAATCCTDKDPCRDARRRAEYHRNQVKDRWLDLKQNNGGQPYYQVGRPPGTYRFDVGGHRILFLKHRDELRQALEDIKTHNCGAPPAGAEHAASLDPPGTLSGPQGPLP